MGTAQGADVIFDAGDEFAPAGDVVVLLFCWRASEKTSGSRFLFHSARPASAISRRISILDGRQPRY